MHVLIKTETVQEFRNKKNPKNMVPIPTYYKIFPIMHTILFSLLVTSSVFPVHSYNFMQGDQTQNSAMIRAHLQKINKPSTKTIQSPDGDLIDCVLFHQQPAFDHPLLKGKMPLDPPVTPKGENPDEMVQLWSLSGESCPEGTIPIRRTTEQDVLRASSIKRFGRKVPVTPVSSLAAGHEHSYGIVTGQDQYYGAKATVNVWAPQVANQGEFSLAQMWLTAGSFGTDLNTIEAGWQVLYGDSKPRLFVFWTRDYYQKTGCYNMECPGFVQTHNKIVLGAAIANTSSSYEGNQTEISLLVQKDPENGNWLLTLGSAVVGYWPSELFTYLSDHATTVQFGGEIVNTGPAGAHTSTQMGSGHFSGEGYRKAAYFRDLQVVGQDNNLVPVSGLQLFAEQPNCYNISGGTSNGGQYFYYGGPGRNENCP